MTTHRYQAFVSYSHSADGEFAPALQRGMQQLGRSWHQRRAMEVFRDETGLSVDPDLWGAISTALDASEWFVLLASSHAAASHWVGQEIEHCIATKGTDKLLIVLSEGTLRWDAQTGSFSEDSTALHPALSGLLTTEPRIIDLSWTRTETDLDLDNVRFRADIARIVSVIRDQPLQAVTEQDAREGRRTKTLVRSALAALTAAATVAVVAAVSAGVNWRVAADEQSRAESEARIALAREFAALAGGAEEPRAALALAVEAYSLAPGHEHSGSLLTAITGTGSDLIEAPSLLPEQYAPADIRSTSRPGEGADGRVSMQTIAGSVVLDLGSGQKWHLPGSTHHLTPDGAHAISEEGDVLALREGGAVDPVAQIPALGTAPSFTEDGALLAYRHHGTAGAQLVVADIAGQHVRTAPLALGSDCVGCYGDASWLALSPDGSRVAARIAPAAADTPISAHLLSFAVGQDALGVLARTELQGTGMVRFSDDGATVWARDAGEIRVLDPTSLEPVGETLSVRRSGPLRFLDDHRAVAPADGCTVPGIVAAPSMATVAALPAELEFTEVGCLDTSPPGVEPDWLLGGTWVRTSGGAWPTGAGPLLDLACTALGAPMTPGEFATWSGVEHTPIGCSGRAEET